MQTARVMLRYL